MRSSGADTARITGTLAALAVRIDVFGEATTVAIRRRINIGDGSRLLTVIGPSALPSEGMGVS